MTRGAPPPMPASSPLIAAPDLARLVEGRQPHQPPLVVLDCRFSLADPGAGARAFDLGHVPGARHADLDHDLSGPKTGRNGRHPLPDPADFAATLARWGIGTDTPVVAYDDAGGIFAARAWWMLHRWWGLAHVRVLDGGWTAWQACGGPLQIGEAREDTALRQPSPRPQAEPAPSSTALNQDRLATAETQEVLARLPDLGRSLCLVDARAPDRFQGHNETLDPVGGHIPGAVNRFYALNLDVQGRFKPAEVLREEFTALLGRLPPERVIHQCGSGVTACHNLLAMTHAGLPGSRLYPGSWSEWCADPTRPAMKACSPAGPSR